MKRNFVVLTRGRSGSTWVMDTLNRLDRVKAYGELFLSRTSDGRGILSTDHPRYIDWQSKSDQGRRPFSTFSYLDALYSQPETTGFKLMYAQLRKFPEILLYILKKRVVVVHLVRTNQLDILISQLRAQLTGSSHLRHNDTDYGPTKVPIEVRHLKPKLADIRNSQRRASRVVGFLPIPTIEVTYENLSTSGAEWRALFSFLGIDEQVRIPKSGLKKRAKQSRFDVISNIEEVAEALKDTEFQALLEQH